MYRYKCKHMCMLGNMVKACPRPFCYRVATSVEIGEYGMDAALTFFQAEHAESRIFDVRGSRLDTTWFYSKEAATNRGMALLDNEWYAYEAESTSDQESVENHPIQIWIGKFKMPKYNGPYGIQQCYKPGDQNSQGVHPDGARRLEFVSMLPMMANKFNRTPGSRKRKAHASAENP